MTAVDILRTPDDAFIGLAGYPFSPHYVEVDGLRIHYVDEGDRDAAPILLMHGEPSWSYLYRSMIPPLTAAGYRVIAPDLVGFGRSDKPMRRDAYTYQRHVDWMAGLLLALDLRGVTLFCQDWGGLIGLRLVAEHGERFARVIAANTGLPTGDQPMGRAFERWRSASQAGETLDISAIMRMGCAQALAPEAVAAYIAPFPDERYKVGARQFPLLVPTTPDDPAAPANRAAWQALMRWTKPFLTAFSDRDPITRGGAAPFQSLVPGAQGLQHVTIQGAGHFLQEDAAPRLVEVVLAFIAAT